MRNGWTPLRATAAFIFSFGWLLRLSRADTYDIGVSLYTDANCLFWANDFLALDGGCYANKWATNSSTKGFLMKIVYFNPPQTIHLTEFSDDCHTKAMPTRRVITGKGSDTPCFRFMGSMYAQFTIRFRSNTCQGSQCSTLGIAVQTFYNGAGCAGSAYSIFRYPVQGECLRASNGTQDLTASSDESNLTLVDYSGSTNCEPAEGGRQRTYSITNKYCYPLYTTRAPRSFSWRVERHKPFSAASTAHRSMPRLPAVAATVAALLAATLGTSARWRGC